MWTPPGKCPRTSGTPHSRYPETRNTILVQSKKYERVVANNMVHKWYNGRRTKDCRLGLEMEIKKTNFDKISSSRSSTSFIEIETVILKI